MADHREHHHAEPVVQHCGVECQRQGLAWPLPVLNRPEDQRSVERLHVDAAIGEKALTPPLPAGGQASPQGQMLLPAIKTDGFAQQQTRHHPRQEHQMAQVDKAAVLTQQRQQVSLKVGLGIHWDLDCRNSNFPWFPAHPMS